MKIDLDKRIKLLNSIYTKGYNNTLKDVCSGILATGNSSNMIINELVDNGLVIKVKVKDNYVKTFLTSKGEKALSLLTELNEVLGGIQIV